LTGGIFGADAGQNGGNASATNCYSTGSISSGGGGIFGSNAGEDGGTAIATNCYSANGSWSDSSANSNLQGTPSGVVGNFWVSTGVNQPYELNNICYIPYSINNINTVNNTLIQNYSQNIQPGQSSIPAIISGQSYSILQILNGDPSSYGTITIDNNTGVISTTNQTVSETYTIYLRNTGSYNITTFTLTVESSGPIPCLTEDTTILTPSGYINVKELNKGDYVITSNNKKQKIKNIFYTKVSGNDYTYPYIIPKDSISDNYPIKDTKISGCHLILYGNKWIHPSMSRKFKQCNKNKVIKYYHIELGNYETEHLLINDGLIVESFGGFNNNLNNEIYLKRQ
jgi:hypothetical protein